MGAWACRPSALGGRLLGALGWARVGGGDSGLSVLWWCVHMYTRWKAFVQTIAYLVCKDLP